MPYTKNQGVRIHYEVEGNGALLVLQHGFGSDLETWRDRGYAEGLKGNYRLVMIDARGHGLSDKPHDPKLYEMKLRASDVVAVLDELKVERAHYFGYSMGGRIGFAIAKYSPERVLSLVLGGIHPFKLFSDSRDRRIEMFRKGMEAYITYLEKQIPLSPQRKTRLLAGDTEAYIAATLASKAELGFQDILPTMAMPCLLFAGEADDVYARAKQAASEIPNATFISFPKLNHLQTIAQSALVLPQVIKFLRHVSEGVEYAKAVR